MNFMYMYSISRNHLTTGKFCLLRGNDNSADYICLVLETVHVAHVCSIVMKRGPRWAGFRKGIGSISGLGNNHLIFEWGWGKKKNPESENWWKKNCG